ncbi:MAG: acyl-CoA dehydrogenase family protein [Halobacteriota archaeon]|uniref:acyl-CoA dehydrogenase family protein n=1 Tax=Natronomonas sp. TaxID=2184060 RepID=UPI003975F2B0
MSWNPDQLAGDFEPPESVRPTVERVREFVRTDVKEIEKEYEEYFGDPVNHLDENAKLIPELHEAQSKVRRRSAEEGIYALHLPEGVGGGGLSQLEHFYVIEEVFRYGTGHGSGLTKSVLAWTEGPSAPLLHLDEEQREEWLAPLVEGRKTACIGITEPGAGSDVGAIQTTAERDGDGWVLNGHKRYITNGPYADTAQILAKTDRADGADGMAMFLVDMNENPGIRSGKINTNLMMDGITSDVHLDDCRVGDDQVVGEVGQGLQLALAWINWRRINRGGMCVGMGEYLLDRMLSHAENREAFGEPIGHNQAVQWPIVETATELKATRAFAIQLIEEYESIASLEDLRQPPEARQLLSMLKYYPEDQLFEWSDRAIQVLGGHGLMRAGGVERVFRVARNLRIPAGATEIQKSTIAKTLGLGE